MISEGRVELQIGGGGVYIRICREKICNNLLKIWNHSVTKGTQCLTLEYLEKKSFYKGPILLHCPDIWLYKADINMDSVAQVSRVSHGPLKNAFVEVM